jgi:hypothetical protein
MTEVKQQGQYWMNVASTATLFPTDGVGGASTTGTLLQGVRESVVSHVVVTAVSGQALISFRRQNVIPGNADGIGLFRLGLTIPSTTVVPYTVRFGHSGIWFGPGKSEATGEVDLGFDGEGGMWSVARAGTGAAGLEFTVFFNIIS